MRVLFLCSLLSFGTYAFSHTPLQGSSSGSLCIDLTLASAPQLLSKPLPAVGNGMPWGGNDSSKWQAEAILANAASTEINESLQLKNLKDVIVAVPTKFNDSKYRPYGDGQTNSEVSFGGWSGKRPPMVSVLREFTDGNLEVEFVLDGNYTGGRTQIEISYKLHTSPDMNHKTAVLDGHYENGLLKVLWKNVPQELNWKFAGQLTSVFVRPYPQFNDWLQVYFRFPRHSVDDFIASVPVDQRTFPFDNKPLLDPENLRDMGDGILPMDKALQHQWPAYRYNINNLDQQGTPKPYIPENVHAQLGPNGRYTAVGKGYTWVTENNTHFKTMYTGFDGRNIELESLHGVPSGSGWHVMGDIITLINYHERAPMLAGAGFSNPALRFGIAPSDHSFAYGLSDVAVIRILLPGEAFVTVPALFPDRDQDHQWYAITTDHKFLAEEWVHPNRPAGDNPAFK